MFKLIIFLFALLLNFQYLFAEGTKQLWPSGLASEKVGLMMWRFPGGTAPLVPFASYDAVEGDRLHVNISNTSEKIYYGFNIDPSSATGTVYYRIKDPNGNIVFGPALVPTSGAGFIPNHAQAVAGPDVLSVSGYNSLDYQPLMTGDYYIEFNPTDPNVQVQSDTRLQYFDITVVDGVTEKPGRLWSRKWELCQFNFTNRTYSSVFIYSTDGVVSKLDFNGMQAYGFEVHANPTGPRSSGSPLSDRQSSPGNVTYYDYKVFLQDPDILVYPTGAFSDFGLRPAFMSGCSGSYCINVDYTGSGYAEILLDFNNNGVNDANDVLLTANVPGAGYHCFQWDGKNSGGAVVGHGFGMSLEATVLAGITHYPVYDAENHIDGFLISTIRPIVPNPNLYYDDSPIGGGVELNGCATPCHTWTGDFGDLVTINSWWFGASVSKSITLLNNQCDPVANNDFANTYYGTSQNIGAITNDSDSDGDDIFIVSAGTDISNGATFGGGTMAVNDNGTPGNLTDDYFIYTPDNGFTGLDSTYYYINDEMGGRDTAVIFIFVDFDLDQDGLTGTSDLDSDNDGVLDTDEDGGTGFHPSGDEDGDGIPNYLDWDDTTPGFVAFVDANGDGTNDLFDTDLDGSPDNLDFDSDNDGIPDAVEANNGEEPLGYDITYGQIVGADSDGDGLLDAVDNAPSVAYGAGSTSNQPFNDTDGDGVKDLIDPDSDNDGIFDVVEAGGNDVNNDGIIDGFTDVNNDGYFDGSNFNYLIIDDLDGDGIPNFLDLDSDGDGIDDAREAFSTANDPSVITYVDSDGDGVIDQFDVTNGGVTAIPVDTDNDGIPDYLDLDSDGDGANDIVESNDADLNGSADSSPSGLDNDNDGLDNTFDTTPNGWGGESNVPEQNQDADAEPDWRDVFDLNNPGIFYYVCNNSDQLFSLNPFTGSSTLSGANGVTNIQATAYWDGVLFASNSNALGTLNPVGGTYTNLGEYDGGGTVSGAFGNITLNNVDALSFHPWTGELYGVNKIAGNDVLFKIDPATGLYIADAFGAGIDYVAVDGAGLYTVVEDIAIDPLTGDLFATANNALIKINKFTGSVTLVGNLAVTGIRGLSFYNDGTLYGSRDVGPATYYIIDKTNANISTSTALACDNVEAFSALVAPVNHITGQVWDDTNQDQSINGGETGIAGVTVNLYYDVNGNGIIDGSDLLVQTEVTDGSGNYDFTFAAIGNLLMSIDQTTLPVGYGLTTDNLETAIFADNTNFDEDDSNNNFGATFSVDCDGDGIPDLVEGDIGVDTDGDGVDDMCDLDSDNDGILDSEELNEDTDLDGIPDFQDLDSDNDGIPDAIEANSGVAIAAYQNNGGYLTGVDTDGDGLLDVVDNDPLVSYGASSTSIFANPDHDGDGIADSEDLDSDNDGILDLVEATDNPYVGLGVLIDANNDGMVDGFTDNNNDGYHDAYVFTPLPIPNSDGNGNPNYIDLDSDDDGIDDTTEGLATGAYATPGSLTDSDGDGILDFWDISNGGQPIAPEDTDLDGTPDYADEDSDDDSVLDIIEGNDANQDGIADSSPSGSDTDGDGIDNSFDNNPTNWGDATNTPHQNSDGDAEDDWRDTDDDDDGIPTYDEVVDLNGNGTPDYLEVSPCPIGQTEQVTVVSAHVTGINNSVNVTSANNTIGAPNGTVAIYNNANSYIIFDFGTVVPAGTTMTITWRSNVGTGTTVGVGEWIGSWSFVNNFTTTSTTLTTTTYTALNNHRYMYVQQTGGGLPSVDAVSYSNTTSVCEDDFDMDGIPNSIDEDDDNDGIADIVEGSADSDGDGQINSLDLDSDNDGIVDAIEANQGVLPANMNGEGAYSAGFLNANDTDGNGWYETSEGGESYANNVVVQLDSDGDGIVDRLDKDSDGDGILDIVEANTGVLPNNGNTNGQFPAGYVVTNDVDNDGIVDDVDPDQGGTPLDNPDTDGDGIPNYLDLDSDGDLLSDNLEGFDPNVASSGGDADVDGIDNSFDTDQGGTFANLPDEDCNLIADYLDGIKNTAATGNFTSGGSWSNGVVPVPGKSIVVRNGHTLSLVGNTQVASVFIQTGGTLNINGYELTVTGYFNVDGSFIHGNGKVLLSGSCTQTVCGDAVFYDLEVNNSNGVNMDCGNISVANELTLTDGIMSTCGANSFTMESTSSGTAYIASSGTGTVICDVTFERYKEGCADGWMSLGSPFATNTLNDWDNDIVTAGFPGSDWPSFSFVSIYSYDETPAGIHDIGWTQPNSINDAIIRGKGYYVYEGTANYPLTLDVTGVPNLNTFTFPVNYTSNGSPANDGWNLLANPYPSAIEWDLTNSSKWINVGCCDATYIWNECVDQFASYISSVGTNGGSNVIPSSSAFWIKSHFPGASLKCTREAMAPDYGDFRSGPAANVDAVMTLHIDGFSREDEVKFRVLSTASHGHDDFGDALKVISTETNMGIYITDNQMGMKNSIEAFPNDGTSKVIPVWVRVPSTGSYTLDFTGGASLPSDMCFIFEDLLTGTSLDLKTATYYTCNIDAVSNFENRFIINVSYPIEPIVTDLTCKNAQDGQIVFNANGVGPYDVIWTDSLGNIVRQVNTTGNDTLQGITAGDYTLNVIDNGSAQCNNGSKTVTVSEPTNGLTVTGLAHKQNCDGSNGFININVGGGLAPYTYAWSNGVTVQDNNSVAPGTYQVEVTDANGCENVQTYVVDATTPVTAMFTIDSDTIITSNGETVTPFNSSSATNYVWYWGDGNVSVDAQPEYTYTQDGDYLITLIASAAGCSDTLTHAVTVIGAVGVQEVSDASGVNSYFADNNIWVSFDKLPKGNVSISVYDGQGKLVMLENGNSGNTQIIIPVNTLANGNYIVSIETDKGSVQQKVNIIR